MFESLHSISQDSKMALVTIISIVAGLIVIGEVRSQIVCPSDCLLCSEIQFVCRGEQQLVLNSSIFKDLNITFTSITYERQMNFLTYYCAQEVDTITFMTERITWKCKELKDEGKSSYDDVCNITILC